MSKLTYISKSRGAKPLVWLQTQIKTPPLSRNARVELGYYLRLVQQGVIPGMPHSRSMKNIGRACSELRVRDAGVNWRLVYRVDQDAIVVVGLFVKMSRAATDRIIEVCRKRLSQYDAAVEG